MSEEEILELIKDRLSLNLITTSEYTGGDDSLYEDSKTIRLMLDGNVISEIYLM